MKVDLPKCFDLLGVQRNVLVPPKAESRVIDAEKPQEVTPDIAVDESLPIEFPDKNTLAPKHGTPELQRFLEVVVPVLGGDLIDPKRPAAAGQYGSRVRCQSEFVLPTEIAYDLHAAIWQRVADGLQCTDITQPRGEMRLSYVWCGYRI